MTWSWSLLLRGEQTWPCLGPAYTPDQHFTWRVYAVYIVPLIFIPSFCGEYLPKLMLRVTWMGFEQALECLDHVFIFYVYLEITQQMFLREMFYGSTRSVLYRQSLLCNGWHSSKLPNCILTLRYGKDFRYLWGEATGHRCFPLTNSHQCGAPIFFVSRNKLLN